jgi:uncharacterized protein YjbJ (UPF0337 family)
VREDRRQKAEGRRQKAEGRRQKAEGRRQKAEGRRQKARLSAGALSGCKIDMNEWPVRTSHGQLTTNDGRRTTDD